VSFLRIHFHKYQVKGSWASRMKCPHVDVRQELVQNVELESLELHSGSVKRREIDVHVRREWEPGFQESLGDCVERHVQKKAENPPVPLSTPSWAGLNVRIPLKAVSGRKIEALVKFPRFFHFRRRQ